MLGPPSQAPALKPAPLCHWLRVSLPRSCHRRGCSSTESPQQECSRSTSAFLREVRGPPLPRSCPCPCPCPALRLPLSGVPALAVCALVCLRQSALLSCPCRCDGPAPVCPRVVPLADGSTRLGVRCLLWTRPHRPAGAGSGTVGRRPACHMIAQPRLSAAPYSASTACMRCATRVFGTVL
jgi:hypothetical protein